MDLDGHEAGARVNIMLQVQLPLLLIQPLAHQIELASFESDEVAVEQGALNERQISRAGVFAFRHPGKAASQLESGGI